MNIFHFLIIAVIATWLSLLSGEVYAIAVSNCTGSAPSCGSGATAQCDAASGTWSCVQNVTPTQTPPSTPTTPTTPSSNTGSSPAQSGLAPPANKTVYYPNKMTFTTPAVDYNYSDPVKFPQCLNDPSMLTTTQISSGTVNPTPAYPDIEKNMASSGAALPPDQCVVTSRVLCKVNGVDNQPCTSFTNTTQTINSAIAAVCPPGYVQVGSFNMQPEVKYNTSPATKVSPTDIKNMQDYQYYINQGYTCSVSSYPSSLVSPCISAAAGAPTPPYTFNYGIHTPVPNPSGPGVVEFDHLEYHNSAANNACYTGNSTCSGTPDNACYLGNAANSPSYGASSSSMSVTMVAGPSGINPFTSMSTYVWFYYGNISCSLPINTPYFTANMAPRSLVCARLKSQYDKINK